MHAYYILALTRLMHCNDVTTSPFFPIPPTSSFQLHHNLPAPLGLLLGPPPIFPPPSHLLLLYLSLSLSLTVILTLHYYRARYSYRWLPILFLLDDLRSSLLYQSTPRSHSRCGSKNPPFRNSSTPNPEPLKIPNSTTRPTDTDTTDTTSPTKLRVFYRAYSLSPVIDPHYSTSTLLPRLWLRPRSHKLAPASPASPLSSRNLPYPRATRSMQAARRTPSPTCSCPMRPLATHLAI